MIGLALGQVAGMWRRSRVRRVMLTTTSTMTKAGFRTLLEYQRIAMGVTVEENPYPTAPLMTAAPKARTASQTLFIGIMAVGPAPTRRPLYQTRRLGAPRAKEVDGALGRARGGSVAFEHE